MRAEVSVEAARRKLGQRAYSNCQPRVTPNSALRSRRIASTEHNTQRPAPDSPLIDLTAAELQILAAMGAGLSNEGISAQMFISAKTVERHIGSIFRKLRLYSEASGNRRVQAVLIWIHATPRSPA